MIAVKMYYPHHWHRVRLMLVALACAASVIFFYQSAHAQGETGCFTAPPATKSQRYVVPKGYVAWPGDGKSYPENARVWGSNIVVCPSSDSAGGDEFNTGASETATGDGSTNTGWKLTTFGRWAESPVVQQWVMRLRAPAPTLWPTYVNIPNPLLPEFRVVIRNGVSTVPDGAEYGVPAVPFCQQDSRCDFVVPARHYRLITADYDWNGYSCRAEGRRGCLLLLINVGDETYVWRNQMADAGFSVPGRYWNGDALEWAVWGIVSHASANMMNFPTLARPGESLNFGVGTNGGSNCSVPEACEDGINVTVGIHAGDAMIAVLQTIVTK